MMFPDTRKSSSGLNT